MTDSFTSSPGASALAVERTLTTVKPVDDMVEFVLRFVPNILPPVGDVFNQESFILRSGGGSHDEQREQEDDLHG